MSLNHWLNIILTPLVMIWPDLFPPPSILLWFIELSFILDICRKFVVPKSKVDSHDFCDIFQAYLKSSFILDLIATAPHIITGMDLSYTGFKIIRAYEIHMLEYVLEKISGCWYDHKTVSELSVFNYAMMTIIKIVVMLHYLSCMWIYVGSEAYLGYEEGHVPWQYANEDFEHYDRYQIYVFSTYWVCTVITTVGYGDYSGGTSAEYALTIFLELFGLVIFTML